MDNGENSTTARTEIVAGASNSSSRGSLRPPPVLDTNVTYEMWKKQLKHWQICCRLDKDQQASELVLSLLLQKTRTK